MTENSTPLPLFFRVLFAPVALIRVLVVGAKWRPLETQVVDAVSSAVPDEWRELLDAQMREVTYIGRSHDGNTEVVLARGGVLGTGRGANPLPLGEPERKLAIVDLVLASGKSVRASVWLTYGVLSIIEFDRVVELRERANSSLCKLLIDDLGEPRRQAPAPKTTSRDK